MTTPTAPPPATDEAHQHILVIVIDRRNSGLERVMSLFRRRGPAFSSMHIEPTDMPDVLRLTVYVTATNAALEQAMQQLRKIIDIQALHTLNI